MMAKRGAEAEAAILNAEQRRERVATAYVRGVQQSKLAVIEGVSQKTICLDLKKIREGWAKRATEAIGSKILEELAKIDNLEAQCWEAWEASRQNNQVNSEEIEECLRSDKDEDGEKIGSSSLVPVSRKLKVTSKDQTGDSAFLARISWCIETRLKLLDAFPKERKVGIDVPDGSKVVVFIEDMHQAPSRRPSDDIEARLAQEQALLGNSVVVEQAPPPSDSSPSSPSGTGRNGSP